MDISDTGMTGQQTSAQESERSSSPADSPRHDEIVRSEVSVLLSAWYRRARESQMSHYTAAEHCTRLNRSLGIPSVVFSAAVGTTLFATAQHADTSSLLQIGAGAIAFAASALAALQTFLGLSERASKHLATGAAYGAIRREIEQLQITQPTTSAEHSPTSAENSTRSQRRHPQ